MRRHDAVALLLVIGCIAGCSRKLPVQVEPNPSIDTSIYRTYDWASRPVANAPQSQLGVMDWRLRNAIERQLGAKGYIKSDGQPPDFLVRYRIVAKDKLVNTVADYARYREMGGQAGVDQAYVFGYREGTLILEIIDTRSNVLAWRGTASAVVDPAARDELIDEAVTLMIEGFAVQ